MNNGVVKNELLYKSWSNASILLYRKTYTVVSTFILASEAEGY